MIVSFRASVLQSLDNREGLLHFASLLIALSLTVQIIVTLSSACSKRVCMRLSLILQLPFTSSLVLSSQQRLYIRSTRRKATQKVTTMSSNPSALYTPQDIKGWTALVTGASSGFGKALCGNQPVRRVHGSVER